MKRIYHGFNNFLTLNEQGASISLNKARQKNHAKQVRVTHTDVLATTVYLIETRSKIKREPGKRVFCKYK